MTRRQERNRSSLTAEERETPLARDDPLRSGPHGDDNSSSSASHHDEDDDDVTVIIVDRTNNLETAASLWAEQDSPEMEQRRRQVLLRELQRVQRASFIHFLILCLIPTSLLFIVIATVLGENDTCDSSATLCEQEERTFINAFTTRCVCNAIPVVTNDNQGDSGSP
eukprot:scaffold1900_cov123-Cylindrotheca_fusiformis.AAC.46